jgi:hypothetical protein
MGENYALLFSNSAPSFIESVCNQEFIKMSANKKLNKTDYWDAVDELKELELEELVRLRRLGASPLYYSNPAEYFREYNLSAVRITREIKQFQVELVSRHGKRNLAPKTDKIG